MSEIKKNIETCRGEDVLAEVTTVETAMTETKWVK